MNHLLFLKPLEAKTCSLTPNVSLPRLKRTPPVHGPVIFGVLYLMLLALLQQSCLCNTEQPCFVACSICFLCNFSSNPLSKYKYCWMVGRLLFWERSQREPSLSWILIWIYISKVLEVMPLQLMEHLPWWS